MLDKITKGFAKLFGTKSDRDIKVILPIVKQINEEFDKLSSITDDDLRKASAGLMAQIQEELKHLDQEIEALKSKADATETDVFEKEALYAKIDKLDDQRNEELEVVLNNILPQAFAIMKETARRLKDQKELRVSANVHDRTISAKSDCVSIEGETAVWHNSWTAGGHLLTWEMVHYDVQLIGGVVLHQGKIGEMATGEGKTLVATLPAFLNALARRGVHVVTVNDYLAKRDSEWMAPLFQFHGLDIDCIDKWPANSEERRNAYRADITYGTNNEFGFDYLRDNMARGTDELVQRKHHYAMVDEVDSVLIDDARTPLIISGPVPKGDQHEFHMLKPRIESLVGDQKKLAQGFLTDAKRLISEDPKSDEGGTALFRAYRAFPKYKPLIKYLSEDGIRQILQKTENYYMADNNREMPKADEPLLFVIDEKQNSVDLTEKGIDHITGKGEDPQFFILPDIGVEIANLENDEAVSDEDKIVKKEQLLQDYAVKAERIHSVNQLLKAYSLFEKDTEYILDDGKVKIVDEQTGRVMDGRRYSDGLHQALEAKENVKVEDATQTYATITLQNYFRMYHKLGGMTGTAETEAGELWDIYELDVVVIPTNRPIQRQDHEDKVFKTIREKFRAVAEEVIQLREAGRPVLVGTTSVDMSELLSRMLSMQQIPHQVLNAKQHSREAEVVAQAGQPGMVTIATNMAGRGTDIKLTPESKAAGGLAIIGTERHESRRVDRQLRGRAGRQGDVGSSQFFVSLEDSLMRMFGSERIAKVMDRMGLEEGEVIQHSMITKSIERAQRKVEENNFGIRKRLLEYDDVMNQQREVIYDRRRNALFGERLSIDIMNQLYDVVETIVIAYKESLDLDGFKLEVLNTLGVDYHIAEDKFNASSVDDIANELFDEAYDQYKKKNEIIGERAMPVLEHVNAERGAMVENIMVPFTDGKKQLGIVTNLSKNIEDRGKTLMTDMEKSAALAIIDNKWKEHLREMDDLKQSVQNAAYEQKDPLMIYKFEAFELFKKFLSEVNNEAISFLMKASIPIAEPEKVQEAREERPKQEYNTSKAETGSALSQDTPRPEAPEAPKEKTMPIRKEVTHGRNDLVSVRYNDGSVKENVKFKKVENDLAANKCVLID
ncbi:preprotein translocase subunit SecA [Persicobacter psychrovividus]|uniref:Protein translocase subunit SecA n=1 Tax=Persicobacter psychrovividus TaxID=387638 RepID=A0ABM7VHA6_9BACT|nr:protein translocase subunit SecA [Persicobacter psychrovividus]